MDGTSLDVAIAAGGTAGHINPALALAEELVARGHRITFYGQPDRLEATLVPEAGFDFVPLHISGFDRSRPHTLVTALAKTAQAKKVVERRFDAEGVPDVAIGFGAYVELPLLDAARSRKVPTLIHEQNSVPGLANKIEARSARRVCISFPAAAQAFKGDDVVMTGNPVRSSVMGATREGGRRRAGIPADALVLLVFGGSLGARHINQGIAAAKAQVLARPDVYVIHSTGKGDYDDAVAELALAPSEAARWRVMPYISDMGDMLAAADLVLSRAGASSLAEIAALAVPSILVPYPFATADHQTTNARFLVDAGAAELVADEQIDTPAFERELLALLDDPGRRARMRAKAKGLGQERAASSLADQVESVARAAR
ncbi:MAG: undecaprenyldiphospho-muramoylpentapeptide beta-N-acetylglucosaminyltransferase [Atopobiaceae bacterium]|jgi:UDP-N-acetylglucosamine--N-acetylmuramyl-(pentapeptide) pyrophosphoryl-undecaprenol N-acetylglucosamine transferase